MAFSQEHRLPSSEIPTLLKQRGIVADHFSIKVSPGGTTLQIAILVPSKIASSATLRNRLRRRVTEGLRMVIPHTAPGQIVVTVRTKELPSIDVLVQELTALLKKSGMLKL